MCTIVTCILVPRFPTDWSITHPFATQSSFPVKVAIMFFIGIVYRIKFYAAWAFTQAAVNNSGVSYDEKGGFS